MNSPHAQHRVTPAGELLDADGSHCVQCKCDQCVEPAVVDSIIEALAALVSYCGRDAADEARTLLGFGYPPDGNGPHVYPTNDEAEAALRQALRCPDDSWVQ